MSDLDLDAIETRLDVATAGPWTSEHFIEVDDDGVFELARVHAPDPKSDEYRLGVVVRALRPDADFIAAARTWVPALIAEVRRLTQQEAAYRSDAEAWRRHMAVQAATDNATKVAPPTVPHKAPGRR